MPLADDHSLVPHSGEIGASVGKAVLKPVTDSFIRTKRLANTIIDEHPAFFDVELALRA
jgi:hypothetical protein